MSAVLTARDKWLKSVEGKPISIAEAFVAGAEWVASHLAGTELSKELIGKSYETKDNRGDKPQG